jgi:hypothetical protein
MSSENLGKKFVLIAGRIFFLLIVVVGLLKAGPPASYYDRYGFRFVLIGGVALLLISFPPAEIWRAIRHAAGASGDERGIRNSAHFWEAAGRGFWILGGLSGVLSIVTSFAGLKSEYAIGMAAVVPMLIRPLLSTFYSSLLAVICFVPCWKLLGKLPSRVSPESSGHPVWKFGAFMGYAIFLAALISGIRLDTVSLSAVSIACLPAFLMVLGGTFALILFIGGNSIRLTPSVAFAGMGLIGSLTGFIQMLHGMTDSSPRGIGQVAGALAIILAACFTALLGMAVIGAPLEDRAMRMGRIGAPSAFSRVSWYVFPLLSLIFLILVYTMIVAPFVAPPPH